jgi:hypothetical protein
MPRENAIPRVATAAKIDRRGAPTRKKLVNR